MELALVSLSIALGALLLFHLTRTTTFWWDEWSWVTDRRGSGLSTLLRPYHDHLSLVPILIYKALFATAGLKHYAAYRLVALIGHLSCVTLVYLYIRRRVGWVSGLSAAVMLMLLGPGWQNILWPFQIAWTVALAAGIGAFMILERRSRAGDIAASLLVALSLASTSVGLALAAGIAVQIALTRRSWSDAWIVLVPLVFYGIWWLSYGKADTTGDGFAIVRFAGESFADSFSALLGLSGATVLKPSGTLFGFGAPLAIAAVVGVLWARSRGALSVGTAPALAVVLVVFWVLTALGRSDLQPPSESRYLYTDAILLLLIIAELLRGIKLGAGTQAGLVLVASLATLSNLGVLRSSAAYLRDSAPLTRADLAALNFSRAFAGPAYIATGLPGYPFTKVTAISIYEAERQLGSPAFTLTQLATASADARETADTEMVNIRQLRLQPAAVRPRSSGKLAPRGACLTLKPQAIGPNQQSQLQVALPPGGAWIGAAQAPAPIGFRRFGDKFLPLGSVPAGTIRTLQVAADGVGRPWRMQLTSMGQASVCPLR